MLFPCVLFCFALFFYFFNAANIESEEDHLLSSSDTDLFISGINYEEIGGLLFSHDNTLFIPSVPYFFSSQVLGARRAEEREQIISYKAQGGDTLSSVAEKFEISENTIKWANGLTSNTISSGDELLILPITSVLYYVERGDTLGEIAHMHKAKAGEIISFNNIEDETKIIAGDRLIIPGGTPPPALQITAPSSRIASSFINPVPGGMITQGVHPYNAVDIHNPCGYPVVAAASGRVTETGYGSWPAGNYIKIDHGNVVILYAHMERIHVSSGSRVYQGQQIGTVGNTGHTIGRTGCHLHFDVLSRRIANPFSRYPVGSRP